MKLTLPSMTQIVSGLIETIRRFPLVMASALLGAVISCVMVITDTMFDDGTLLPGLLLCSMLGIPLFFSIRMWCERARSSTALESSLSAGGVLILAAYYLSLGDLTLDIHMTRFIHLFIGMHLLASIAPYAARGAQDGDPDGDLNGFWQYNRALFTRFNMSALFSLVLFLGLAGALVSLDPLFGIETDEDVYAYLFIVIAFVFNTAFFLVGVPADLAALSRSREYPAVIRVFAQYILIPLVSVYIALLLAYTVKIAFTWDWPSGAVSWLVICASVFGMFALLLIYPYGTQGRRWVGTFSRLFYSAMIPLVALLLGAIWMRVSEHGVTENRYLLLLLAIWLGGTALYFLFSRSKSIKAIPLSLTAVAFLSAFGPWGAYSVSRENQLWRLERVLARHDMLEGGTLTAPGEALPFEDRKEVSSIVLYLVQTHGASSLDSVLGGSHAVVQQGGDGVRTSTNELAEDIVEEMGIEYVSRWQWQREAPSRHFQRLPDYNRAMVVKGYDYSFDINLNYRHSFITEIGERKYQFDILRSSNVISISAGGAKLTELDMHGFIDRVVDAGKDRDYNTIAGDVMTFVGEDEAVKVTLHVQSIELSNRDGELLLDSLIARALLAFK